MAVAAMIASPERMSCESAYCSTSDMARLPISVDDCVHAGGLVGRRAEERMIHHVNGASGDCLSVGGKYPSCHSPNCLVGSVHFFRRACNRGRLRPLKSTRIFMSFTDVCHLRPSGERLHANHARKATARRSLRLHGNRSRHFRNAVP